MTKLDNPYLDDFIELGFPTHPEWWYGPEFRKLVDSHNYSVAIERRQKLMWHYSCAVPTDEVILRFAQFSPIVEVGAGSGYWSWLLKQVGATVRPVDTMGEEWKGISFGRWTDVKQGGPEAVELCPDSTLLLVWPPYGEPMAAECLKHYRGDTLLYVGEGDWGCCGDEEFHETLGQEWQMERMDLPQWPFIHDYAFVGHRR